MGIGNTMKNILGSDNAATDAEKANLERNLDDPTLNTTERDIATSGGRRASRAFRLPSGTGPGTSGKGVASATEQGAIVRQPSASEAAMQRDVDAMALDHSNIAGYGTDAAAAAGGDMAGTHQGRLSSPSSRTSGHFSDAATGTKKLRGTSGVGVGTSMGTSTSSQGQGYASSGQIPPPVLREDRGGELQAVVEQPTSTMRSGGSEMRGFDERDAGVKHSGVLSESHHFGHNKNSLKDSMPGDNAQEDTNQLQPITHERVRHLETEEVSRVKELERHIHHIQHHTQPVVASEELAEQYRENTYPVTLIREKHANKVEDNTLFEGQVHQFHDTLTHGPKERTIIDKGTVVNEHIHHHVHHVIQPVIEKETIEKHRIMTTIPIREVTHEAPVVHQSQTHAPVPMEHFLQRGGNLKGAVAQDEISKKLLHNGQCMREVDGVAETLERELKLGKSGHGHDDIAEAEEHLTKKSARQMTGTTPTVASVRN